ncbi:hypothetical protein KLEB303S_gp33 [Bacillus phage vB_BceS_KLEB30-3S]|uniref:hypothetical protein n=1 Tax=Bacillus wiedmannii TaxID=1890302 RepID=UPI001435AC6B|nr:hypothetical protein [Bacillus wiedmannii]MDM5266924.1 hypothetical protein [Bacillus wiedmannii]QIQ68035.1 hypothetical protein KLEB303S_gp33 [Bacillus phage vB_BceS_KLEB30-3S]
MNNNKLWFSTEVANATYNISTAILLQRFQEIAVKQDSRKIEIVYGEMFPEVENGFMKNRLHLLNTIRTLENYGYGKFYKGNGAKRIKPVFEIDKKYHAPDKFIEFDYLINDGIKLKYVHNMLVRLFGSETIDLHESELVEILADECNDTISESGIRKSLVKLNKRGYLTFVKGNNKGKNSKKREGYKIYKTVKPI